MRTRPVRSALVVGVAALLAPLALPTGAQAAPPLEESYNVHEELSFQDDCDPDRLVTGSFHELWQVRAVPGSEDESGEPQAFFGKLLYQERTVVTDTDGDTATVRIRHTFQELTAQPVAADDPVLEGVDPEGPVWRFIAQESLQVMVRSSDGGPVHRATLQLRFDSVFDTLGDSEVGGQPLSETVVREKGTDPFEGFCEAIDAALAG